MIDLPEWVSPEVWKAFEEMRKLRKKPMTDYARQKIVNRLLAIFQETGDHPDDILDQSTVNAWQGVWPIKKSFEETKDEIVRKEARAGTGPVIVAPIRIDQVMPSLQKEIRKIAQRKLL